MKNYLLIILSIGFFHSYSQSTIKLTRQVNKDHSIDVNYSSDYMGSVCIYIDFMDYSNTFPPRKKYIINDFSGTLFTLRPLDKDKCINFSYKFTFIRGIPDPKIDKNFIYLIPFKSKTSFTVSSLFNIKDEFFGLESPENWKAFQFISSKPDTVCAIRKGIVVKVENNFSTDISKEYIYKKNVNRVMVEHPDGTLASYSGFDGKNIFVKEGDKIFPNQAIGQLAQYDKRGDFRLHLSVFYVSENSNKLQEAKDKFSYVYLDPIFLTENGNNSLEENTSYNSIVSDEIIKKEMSKKEIKKLFNH